MLFIILPSYEFMPGNTFDGGAGTETYGFDAIRGIQAGHEFYIVMCPLKIIPKLFIFNDYDLPPELRAQRILRESRIPAIKNYILSNPDNYIFSSLTASVDGVMKFNPIPSLGSSGKMGRLYVSMDSRLLINDGQHRRKAIEEALKERPDLGHEMISVVFFKDDGLKRSQQMFADLNKNAVKPTKSLNILYDHRDAFAQNVIDLINIIEIFKNRVELEKTSLSNRTTKVFTLNAITDSTLRFCGLNIGRKLSNQEKELVKEFWNTLSQNIPLWQMVIRGKISPDELRKDYVVAHSNMLNVLGKVGNILYTEHHKSWKEKLTGLQNIDWSRNNADWEGRLVMKGRMLKNSLAIELAVNTVLQKLGISLGPDRLKFEKMG